MSYQSFFDRTAKEKEFNYMDAFTRLLAGENIQIVEVLNAPTASFDLKDRVITLPIFTDEKAIVNTDKNVKILFRSHEVGHALHTPYEGLHNAIKESYGYNRPLAQCINLVEDIRIERLMKSRFVGLNRIYQNAYEKLLNAEFFGDLDAAEAFSRFNLRAKIGAESFRLYGIKFSDKETAIYSYLHSAKTFDDVVVRSKFLLSYLRELQDDIDNNVEQYVEQPKSRLDVYESDEDDNGDDFGDEINPDDYDEVVFHPKKETSDSEDTDDDGEDTDTDADGEDDGEGEGEGDKPADDLDKSEFEDRKAKAEKGEDLPEQHDEWLDLPDYEDVSDAVCDNTSTVSYGENSVIIKDIISKSLVIRSNHSRKSNNFFRAYAKSEEL